ncbi:hypothetical protein KAI87_16900, partial [Myxococcota bacterium]|nr:hypothetical protein [Myxococcota bacterium]
IETCVVPQGDCTVGYCQNLGGASGCMDTGAPPTGTPECVEGVCDDPSTGKLELNYGDHIDCWCVTICTP